MQKISIRIAIVPPIAIRCEVLRELAWRSSPPAKAAK